VVAVRKWNPDVDLLYVKATDDYRLELVFSDGYESVYDARHLLGKGVFKKFEDLAFFTTAHVGYGTVVWDDMLDLAPEAIYEDSQPLSGEN
jgi:hypothetical protein